MIFTTECPSCDSNFPIDSAKVPDGGVYARCSECSDAFLVVTPDPAEDAVGDTRVYESLAGATDSVAVAGEVESDEFDSEMAEATTTEAVEAVGAGEDAMSSAEAIEPELTERPAVADHTATADGTAAEAPAAEAPASAPIFGKRDPNERAARLARVLVSDMIAYHPDRHSRSLEEGTLPQEFDEEIQKSWAEYVDQVGKDLAETTPYFRDALNKVLARGAEVF